MAFHLIASSQKGWKCRKNVVQILDKRPPSTLRSIKGKMWLFPSLAQNTTKPFTEICCPCRNLSKNFKRMHTVQVTRRKRETQLAHRWLWKMLAVGKSCAKTIRLANSNYSTQPLQCWKWANRKILFFFNWTWISTQLFYFLDIYIFSRLPTFDYWEYLWYTDYILLTINSSLSNSTF